MKKKTARTKKRVIRRKRRARPVTPRPRNVYQALQRVLTLANQMQGRSAALENSLQVLREQERFKVIRDLLTALRETSAGNLIGAPPDWTGENAPDATARALLEVLMETFAIKPMYNIGNCIPVRHDNIPDTVELDRPIGDYAEECTALEVTAVGWSYDGKVLLKPIARPVLQGRNPAWLGEQLGVG
jgi:hypothetical protein